MKLKTMSRKVCLMGSFIFLLTSHVPIIKPAIRDAFRKAGSSLKEKLPSLLKRTKSSIKKGLTSAYQKVRGLKTEKVIDRLLENIKKIGSQIGKIKSCMVAGQSCTASERAAFYATAITILALTAVVVGFTITVAATSKEPDEELNKAIETTSQETKGWKPAAVFQRMTNKLNSFKQNLLSMKQCLIKRRCTKQQKRALYATAGTIMALVTIAIGIGIGSYIYTKKQEAKEQQALLKKAEDAKEEVASEELQRALEQLTLDQAAEELPGPKTKFQEEIETSMVAQREGGNYLQVKAREITSALQRKAKAAIKAIKETPDKAMKLTLFREAKEALDEAKRIASSFVAAVRDFSLEDITTTIQQVLGINIVPVTQTILAIKDNSSSSITFLTALNRVRLVEQIEKLNMDTASFLDKLFALTTQFQFQSEETKLLQAMEVKLTELATAMANKKVNDAREELRKTTTEDAQTKIINRISGEVAQELKKRTEALKDRERQLRTTEERIFIRQEFVKQLDQELRDLLKSEGKPLPPVPIEKEYPFWQTLQEVWTQYPQLLNQLNALSISAPGQLVASVLDDTASTLENLQTLRTSWPKLGSKLVSNELSAPLKILQTQLTDLAQNISNLTNIRPLIHTEGAPANWALFYATLKQLARGKFFSLTKRAGELLYKIGIQNGQLQNDLAQLQQSSQPLSNVSSSVKTKFVEKLTNSREDPLLRNVAKAPKLLRNAVGETISDIKIALNNILDSSGNIIYRLGNILGDSDALLRTLNDFMGSTADKAFVSHRVIQAIEPIASNAAGMAAIIKRIRTILTKEKVQLNALPMAATPAA